MTDLETFTSATIEALYFTDTGEGDQPGIDAELTLDTLANLRADCRSFWHRFGCYIEPAGMTPEQAGHDFWLTRNGHGAGFWDGDWPEPYGDMLNQGAKCYGEFDTYLGDDGLITTAPELLEFARDLQKWLARAALSGTYDKQGLQSFRDAAGALIAKARGE